ncbi:WhiB family transcriptional regulator [Microbacterium sp. ZXX196]|uniref:WhiB family transcriptional regulator n=1 Tax=Microbacterium sp. ZXX196 TaxID=2609291 RepID=UPI0012B9FA02|nr:WhiB family transcriptional regulator [Microbacterium sp. ZXX196]MTE22749.1 WhiB family transcriptional regulator [Microbacterium sp. ZXX196]
MTAPLNRSEAPADWFVDPVELGVPGVPRRGDDEGDDGALSWQSEALCSQTDPEAFFPEKGGSTRDAKRICDSCDVRAQCLEYALENDERFGIWGGLSERERRRLKRAQQAS